MALLLRGGCWEWFRDLGGPRYVAGPSCARGVQGSWSWAGSLCSCHSLETTFYQSWRPRCGELKGRPWPTVGVFQRF